MRLERVIAATAAAVLGGGVAVAATTTGQPSRPAADRQPPASTPAAPRHAVAPSRPHPARHSARATPRPRPSRPAATPTAAAASRPLFPLPAPPAYPHPCPPPPRPPGPAFHPPKPAVKTHRLPAPVAVPAHRSVDLGVIHGKGMWLTTWADTRINLAAVVARAEAAGLHQLWIRTGGTTSGWYGAGFLSRLLPQAHAAGIKVVAWDFPTLSDPVADARRAATVIGGRFGGERIDGFSPDIEEIYEGTFDTSRRVAVYLSRVRREAGDLPVIATVLRPLDGTLQGRPYRAMAPYVDAFAPMVYWSCTEPGAAALSALQPLARLRPVHLVGQSYDMAAEGGRHGLPSAREIWRFLDVAKRAGAVGASLYVYDQTRAPQWRALTRYPWH